MRQFLLRQNYYKKEEKCMKYMKHLNNKNNNLKGKNLFRIIYY